MRKLVALVFLLTVSLFSQPTFEFLRVDVSPRVAGLGSSFVAANDDPDVVFYNPAGISFLTNTPISFSYTNYLLDINFASLSVSKVIPEIGRFGLGMKYVNYGTFTGADEFGNKMSDFGAGEFNIKGAYGNFLDENFSYGASLGFVYSKLADYSSTAVTFDLGLNYSIPTERINIAFALMHGGTQLSTYLGAKESLPVNVTVGVSKRLLYLPLKLYFDFHKLNDNVAKLGDRLNNFSFGGEFNLGKALRLRLGYDNEKRNDLKIGSYAGLAGFSVGVGIVVSSYNLNYAFSSLGQIPGLHRFGINTTLD